MERICIISKFTSIPYHRRTIHLDVVWNELFHADYAVVPTELVEGIKATEGFCDLELSEDGKTVVSFTAREIPVFDSNPTTEEILNALLGVNR